MSREELARASELLASAADAASGDDADRLDDLANQVDGLSTADRGPDHGRLARLENALGELRESTGAEPTEDINAAHSKLKEYRSGVEGV